MRKHLNQSVQSGAQIMWNFKPPPKVVKKPKTVPKKAERAVQLETVTENERNEQNGAHAGDDEGENSNSDDERAHPGAHGIGYSDRHNEGASAGEYDGFGEINEFDVDRGDNDNTYGSDDEEEEG